MWNLGIAPLKLVIGNYNYSSWSLRAWFFIKRSGLVFDVERLALFEPDFKSTILSISDAARVPVLIDGDHVIWDTLAICEYLREAHLANGGWPSDVYDRARARSLVSEIHSGIPALRHALPMNCRAKRRVELTQDVQSEIQRIDQMWCDPWFVSARERCVDLGILDAFFAPIASRFKTYAIELSPKAREYQTWLLATPEMQEWERMAQLETEVIELEEVGTPL